MSSSTSSSDGTEELAAWRRFALVFAVSGLAVLAGLLAFEDEALP